MWHRHGGIHQTALAGGRGFGPAAMAHCYKMRAVFSSSHQASHSVVEDAEAALRKRKKRQQAPAAVHAQHGIPKIDGGIPKMVAYRRWWHTKDGAVVTCCY